MNFNIFLNFPDNIKLLSENVNCHITDFDSGYALIEKICELLYVNGNIKFYIKGFEELKNLNVFWALMCVIEDLPKILLHMNNDDFNFCVSLYEQGTEKELLFSNLNSDTVNIKLVSLNHSKDYGTIIEKKHNITISFQKLYSDFVHLTDCVCGYALKEKLLKAFIDL
jgi:hypothetical protein